MLSPDHSCGSNLLGGGSSITCDMRIAPQRISQGWKPLSHTRSTTRNSSRPGDQLLCPAIRASPEITAEWWTGYTNNQSMNLIERDPKSPLTI
ncbi:hypothetical protein PoB_007352800 [Plakobranchus ocellatus]|uniref:Uncharacterized protein n=1 Tax=Plakobranchus ocellatus TaxID=259542 RepID=A0AAV4DRQ6_9GAST|nr:hypothetical protein PoB_007352800 [Plakobranchus ocellatus]